MRIFIFILSLLLSACIGDNKIPKGIIPQNDMRRIMWDLMRADAYVNDFIMKDSTRDRKAESAILYDEIFKMHSTTEIAFIKSRDFYLRHPDLLKVITDSLRSDERRVQQYENYKKPQIDTSFKKMKSERRLEKTKQ